MKWKIRIVQGILCIGFLIFGIYLWKTEGSNEIEIPKMDSQIANSDSIADSGYSALYIGFSDLDSKCNFENLETVIESPTEINLDYELNIEPENEIPFYSITDDDRRVLHNIVAGEAIGESYRCKKLVAQCLMNSMSMTGKSASQIRKSKGYDGYWPECKTLYPEAWKDVEKAVSEVFDKGNVEVNDTIEYFYATNVCYSAWHESLRLVTQEGYTRFFSEYPKN